MSEYQCDRQNNQIYFTGDICAEGIMYLKQCIDNLDTEKKSTLYLSSGGGDVDSGLFFYDLMVKQNPDLFTITVCGFVGSAATLPLFALPKVNMYSSATLGFHAIHSSISRSRYQDTLVFTKTLEKKMDLILSIYNKKLNITKDWLSTDIFLNSNEALDLGIISDII